MPNLPLLLLMALLLLSCNKKNTAEEVEPNVFFSLEKYISTEADRLNKENISLDKVITINGKTERRQVSDIDFHKELSLFSKADINKIALAEKYEADTLFFADKSLQTIHYRARDEELNTKEISFYFRADQTLDSLSVKSQSETALASNQNWLCYIPAQGYHILTKQSNLSGDSVSIEVKSDFQMR